MQDRRAFIVALGGAVAALSWVAIAQQQPGQFRIGVLANEHAPPWDAFRRALVERGYVEGRNLTIEWRYSTGSTDRIPALVNELVHAHVDIIVVSNTPAARACMRATSTVPIVMTSSAFPDKVGLVQTLARPGGNVTGLSNLGPETLSKGFQVLREIAPRVSRVATLWNPENPTEVLALEALPAAARDAGTEIRSVDVRAPHEHAAALAGMPSSRVDALFVLNNLVNYPSRRLIADFAMQRRLPSLFQVRTGVEVGGLIAYAPNINEMYAHAATYVDRILKGANPADLPVEQPTKIELIINEKTATALGLTIPSSLRLLAEIV